MVKKITAVLLILITGGIWIYLDYLNKQELAMVEQIRQEFLQLHAQAKERPCQFQPESVQGGCKNDLDDGASRLILGSPGRPPYQQ